MRVFSYVPVWRLKGEPPHTPVEVVSSPDAEWFRNLRPIDVGRKHIRFALMTDGSLYFGDSYEVVHHDICQARGLYNGVVTEPIVVGVMAQVPAGWWCIVNAQIWMSRMDDDTITLIRGLLSVHRDWPDMVKAMGNDPLLAPSLVDWETKYKHDKTYVLPK